MMGGLAPAWSCFHIQSVNVEQGGNPLIFALAVFITLTGLQLTKAIFWIFFVVATLRSLHQPRSQIASHTAAVYATVACLVTTARGVWIRF